jgi:glycosyltransferase involved in cell wall biosynthesis
VRDRGHHVVVYAPDGDLVTMVRDLGLEYLPAAAARVRPGPGRVRDLARLVSERGVDVLHGYEWPPILETYAAARASRRHVAVVGTVMSMAVAPFLPASMPLVVGTRRIQRHEQGRRNGPVLLMEPPIDLVHNRPGAADPAFAAQHPAPEGTITLVVVSRLVPQLKLEGILTAVRAVARLARTTPLRLVVVGDGSAFDRVASLAAEVNREHGREVVLMTGQMADPRPAYEEADICLGMGGSALRALAFAKPLVVQGEGGFFETLTPDTVGRFLEQGWYGVDSLDEAQAVDRLEAELRPLMAGPALRDTLGAFGRDLVQRRFSLEGAAERQEATYADALESREARLRTLTDVGVSSVGLARYRVRRRWQRLTGSRAVDDFNARPV